MATMKTMALSHIISDLTHIRIHVLDLASISKQLNGDEAEGHCDIS